MRWIDSHTHLDFQEFDSDRDEVIKRSVEAGVEKIIVSSTTANRWNLVKKVCSDFPSNCYPAFGLHPMFMDEHKLENGEGDIEKLKQKLEEKTAIAIGEIGLDYYIENPDKDAQINVFVDQLKLAEHFKLPVIIHARKSLDIVLKYLRKFPTVKGSIHSFSGSEQQANQLIEMGYFLSFGGPVTYARATRLHRLIKHIPINKILLETDSPDQVDASHFKQRNEPAYLVNVAEKVAELQEISLEQVANQTTKNANNLFGFSTFSK